MKKVICVKCNRVLDHDTLFCPECGAAIFQHTAPDSKPVRKMPEFSKLTPIAIVLAVVLALILGWNTLSGILAPGNSPQLSTQPSTEQTTPSTTAPTQKPTETTAPSETYAYDPYAKSTQPPETEPTPTETSQLKVIDTQSVRIEEVL